MRNVGTVVRGIRTPIIKENDDLASIVVDSLIKAKESESFDFNNKDVVAITEAVVGIAEGNYVMVDDIATDIKNKFPDGQIGLVFPILSRNRFSMILKGIARGANKITMLLSFPADEVGNGILDEDKLELSKYKLDDTFGEKEYVKHFGDFTHPFTGINMVEFYKEIVQQENADIEFVFANNPKEIFKHTKNILVCDIHTREKTKQKLKDADILYDLTQILNKPINGGFNPEYGLLGSNKATEERLKLFPRSGDILVNKIQKSLKEKTGKTIEVMVYGDGAFKDPIGKIWELADPVVSPAYTSGLIGTGNEIKLKYVADNQFSNLTGDS